MAMAVTPQTIRSPEAPTSGILPLILGRGILFQHLHLHHISKRLGKARGLRPRHNFRLLSKPQLFVPPAPAAASAGRGAFCSAMRRAASSCSAAFTAG